MKSWWGIYNIRSLDGLPAFSVGMGLGVKFAMPGDIFRSQVGVTRNVDSSHRVIKSSTQRLSSPSDRDLVPKMISSSMNPVVETSSLSQKLRGYGFRLDPSSLVLALLPLFIAFISGVLLGLLYTFPLFRGAARLSPSYTQPLARI